MPIGQLGTRMRAKDYRTSVGFDESFLGIQKTRESTFATFRFSAFGFGPSLNHVARLGRNQKKPAH
jgi:hypothetical protein